MTCKELLERENNTFLVPLNHLPLAWKLSFLPVQEISHVPLGQNDSIFIKQIIFGNQFTKKEQKKNL